MTRALARSVMGEWAKVHDLTLSLDTNAYAQHDILADFQKVNNIGVRMGATNFLASIHVQDEDDNARAIDIVFADAAVSLGTENAAVSIGDSTARSIIGAVSITASDYKDYIASQQATKSNIGLPLKCANTTTALWVGAVYRDATGDTYTAAGLRLKLGFLQGL